MALSTLEGFTEYCRYVVAPTSDSDPSLISEARRLGYNSRYFTNIFCFIRVIFPIFLKNRRIDVISTSATHNLICKWMARFMKVRIRQLNVVHGGGEDQYSYANKYRLNDKDIGIVAVSHFVERKLVAHRVHRKNIAVIHNFLHLTEFGERPHRPSFDSRKPESRPLDRSRISVIVVSRLDPVKRLDVLMQAVESNRSVWAAFQS